MADLWLNVKKEINQKVQAAAAMTVPTGGLPLHVCIFNGTAKNERFSLAPNAEGVIMEEEGTPYHEPMENTSIKSSITYRNNLEQCSNHGRIYDRD